MYEQNLILKKITYMKKFLYFCFIEQLSSARQSNLKNNSNNFQIDPYYSPCDSKFFFLH